MNIGQEKQVDKWRNTENSLYGPIYSASQKKGNLQIKLIFLKTAMICQKKFTLLQNSVYLLSFDISYKMYWPSMAKHEPFEMVMSKLICAE